MTNTVITIARQYGSGGRDIGRAVAERLGIPCLDKEIIAQTMRESGFSEELIKKADEKATNSLAYSMMMGSYFFGSQPNYISQLPINDQIFLAESDVIKKAADKGGCVVVGRCGNFILRERKNRLSVFIHADKSHRIQRAIQEYGVPEKKIEDFLEKQDKQRAHYHSFYTDEKWSDLTNYDLSISSSSFGIENTIEMILAAAEIVGRSFS